jgi:hypothetical protein
MNLAAGRDWPAGCGEPFVNGHRHVQPLVGCVLPLVAVAWGLQHGPTKSAPLCRQVCHRTHLHDHCMALHPLRGRGCHLRMVGWLQQGKFKCRWLIILVSFVWFHFCLQSMQIATSPDARCIQAASARRSAGPASFWPGMCISVYSKVPVICAHRLWPRGVGQHHANRFRGRRIPGRQTVFV